MKLLRIPTYRTGRGQAGSTNQLIPVFAVIAALSAIPTGAIGQTDKSDGDVFELSPFIVEEANRLDSNRNPGWQPHADQPGQRGDPGGNRNNGIHG